MMPLLIRILLLVIEVICSILLIGVVLIQKSKGGGLSGAAFGGGMGESLLGARAGNVLTKITVVLTVVFLLNTLALAFLFAGPGDPSLMDRLGPPTAEDILDVEPVEAAPVIPDSPPAGLPAEIETFPVDMPLSTPETDSADEEPVSPVSPPDGAEATDTP